MKGKCLYEFKRFRDSQLNFQKEDKDPLSLNFLPVHSCVLHSSHVHHTSPEPFVHVDNYNLEQCAIEPLSCVALMVVQGCSGVSNLRQPLCNRLILGGQDWLLSFCRHKTSFSKRSCFHSEWSLRVAPFNDLLTSSGRTAFVSFNLIISPKASSSLGFPHSFMTYFSQSRTRLQQYISRGVSAAIYAISFFWAALLPYFHPTLHEAHWGTVPLCMMSYICWCSEWCINVNLAGLYLMNQESDNSPTQRCPTASSFTVLMT